MSKQAAAVMALGIAGAIIVTVFAYMCLQTERSIWGWASLVSAVFTIGGLISGINSKSETTSDKSSS